MKYRWLISLLLATLATSTLVTGCVARAGRLYVRVPPPPLTVEVRGVAPGPEHVWIEGYHRWDGDRYVWVPGHWDRRPRAGAAWVAGHWGHDRHGWYWVEGHWR
jgi:hypothetical protein